jgi:hypothetical protein
MQVTCFGSEFEVPDLLVNTFIKDFDGLAGKALFEEKSQIRESINEIVDLVSTEPDILEEHEYMLDFIRALAMKKALETHGIFYDA